jgi:hypothetical protein
MMGTPVYYVWGSATHRQEMPTARHRSPGSFEAEVRGLSLLLSIIGVRRKDYCK